MIKLMLLLLVFIFTLSAKAQSQWSENNALYFSMDYNIGNYIGLELDANYIYNEKYSFKIGYSFNVRKPKSQPADFKSGLAGFLTLEFVGPFDKMESYHIAAGRIIKLNTKGSIRANLSLGIGLTTLSEPINWRKNPRFLDRNYDYDHTRYRTASLIINPKIEFPFTRIYGLSVSPMAILNKDRTYFGIGIGQMLGVLRKRNKPKPITD